MGTVRLVIQTNGDFAAPQPQVEIGDLHAQRSKVRRRFAREVDLCPRRVPRLPEHEPGDVEQPIAVQRSAPIEHRGHSVGVHEHVVIEQVSVNEMAYIRQVVDQRGQAIERTVKRSGARRRLLQPRSPAGDARAAGVAPDRQQRIAPGGVRCLAPRVPQTEAERGGNVGSAHAIDRRKQRRLATSALASSLQSRATAGW
jgi:hypothetical protein